MLRAGWGLRAGGAPSVPPAPPSLPTQTLLQGNEVGFALLGALLLGQEQIQRMRVGRVELKESIR